jgi:hypothetical protein
MARSGWAGGRPAWFPAWFSTWVDDTEPEVLEAAERVLGHEVANRVSGTYRRSDLFERRVPPMRGPRYACGMPG